MIYFSPLRSLSCLPIHTSVFSHSPEHSAQTLSLSSTVSESTHFIRKIQCKCFFFIIIIISLVTSVMCFWICTVVIQAWQITVFSFFYMKVRHQGGCTHICMYEYRQAHWCQCYTTANVVGRRGKKWLIAYFFLSVEVQRKRKQNRSVLSCLFSQWWDINSK